MDLSQQAIDQILGNAAVGHEFGDKIKELDRRLSMNGMSYSGYDSLTDRQQEIFSQGLFLEPESAMDLREYVMSAVDSCWCPDVVEELHHHSPMLMREIEAEQEKLPDMTIRIGEGISNLNETIDSILELLLIEGTDPGPGQAEFKRYLTKIFKNNNIETSSYQRGSYQFRGGSPIPGSVDIKKLKAWFSKFDLDIEERIPSISDDYDTFIVRARNEITAQDQKDKHGVPQAGDIPAGTEIPYVPRVFVGGPAVGGKPKKKKQILKKTTNPAGLGLADDSKQWGNALEIVTATKAGVNNRFANSADHSEWVAPELISLLEPAQRKGNTISFDTPLSFGTSDLSTISSDYGEVLAAIWGMSQAQNQAFSLPYSKIIFPSDPATKLLDFFAITDTGVKIPVSVKSGPTGGKVTIRNITETAEVLFQMSQGVQGAQVKDQQFIAVDRALDLAPTRPHEPLFIHKVLRQDPANPNSPLGTRTIQVLARIMNRHGASGTTWQDLDVKQVADWLETKTNEELIGNRFPSLQMTDEEGNRLDKPKYVEPTVKKEKTQRPDDEDLSKLKDTELVSIAKELGIKLPKKTPPNGRRMGRQVYRLDGAFKAKLIAQIEEAREEAVVFAETEATGILEPLWREAGSWPKLGPYINKEKKKELLIYSPMGSQMIKLLNESPAIQAELNRLAQALTVVQANVNVDGRRKYLSFKLNKFKDAAFVFDWPGYDAGNSLGFRMVINK